MSDYNKSSSRRRTSTNTGASRRSSTGTKSHSSYSSTQGHSSNGHHRKKKSDLDITQLLMYGIGVLIIILLISLAVKGCGKFTGKDKESTEVSSSDTSAEESGNRVTVDGIDITGMTQGEAKAAILLQYDWNMKVTYKDKEATVVNLMDGKLDELLDEIYAGDKKPSYEINTDSMMEPAKAEAAMIAGNWNMVAKNGGITGYDKATGKFTFAEGSSGVVIDQDKLAQDIVDAIQKKDYKAVITAQTKETASGMSTEQMKERYKTIGTYNTKTTSNKDRNENIRLSSEALNGVIVNPGQEFSFNNATGARSLEKGYKPATAYLNGEIVQEPGGGVCQVSSTLYNAVVFAGLKSTERHAHSYEPSYVTPGEDAMISYGGPDFKFVNNSDYPVAIKTSFAGQELSISIYGIQILKDGEKIRMASKRIGAVDPPPPVYEEDQTLQLDEEKVVKEGVPGSRWSTDLIIYQDDKEVSREFFHNSSYRGKAATIKRNTSGVVVTTEAPTESMGDIPPIADNQPSVEPSGPAGPGQETIPTQPLSPGGTIPQETPASPGVEPTTGNNSPGNTGPVQSPGQEPTTAANNPIAVGPGPMSPGA